MRVTSQVTRLMAEKQLRENRLITPSELARETGLSYPTVLSWVRSDLRRFDEGAIVAFCTYFDCAIGDLLVLDDE